MTQIAKKKIESDFPNLNILEISKIGEGWDNEAYLVNNEIVFRLPKEGKDNFFDKERIQHTQSEIKLLKSIENKLPVLIPKVTHVAPDSLYYGYEFLPGERVTESVLSTEKKKKDFAKLWIKATLNMEKSLDIEEAKIIGLRPFTSNEYRLEQIKKVIDSNLLNSNMLSIAKGTLKNYISAWNSARKVFVHADMGFFNWVYSKENNTYAIIDWSDACIAPIEFHMYRLIEDIPSQIDFACNFYKQISGQKIDKSLLFMCGNASLISMMGEHIGSDKIDKYKERFTKWAQLQDA